MNVYDARMAMDPCARCGQRGHHVSWHETPAETSARIAQTDLILTCVEPGCSRITRALVQIDGWTCWEHTPSAGWPEPDQPCSDDFDCGRSCYEDAGDFVYETTRDNGWGGDEDVQAYCRCEHHEVTR